MGFFGKKMDPKAGEIHEARASAIKKFKIKWEEMEEASNLYRLDQYSEQQLLNMQKQGRVPYVFDYLSSAVNTYQGIQRDRRTDIFYRPVEKGDEVKTEILNAVKNDALRKNGWTGIESDIFQDGLIQKIGVCTYEWSTVKDPNGGLVITRVPPRQMMWDIAAEEYSKQDASWISRQRLYRKRELKARHPEHSEDIDKMSFTIDALIDQGLDRDYINEILDSNLGVVALVEFFEKIWAKRFFLLDHTQNMILPRRFDSAVDAGEAIREIQQNAEAEIAKQGRDPSQLGNLGANFKIISQRVPLIRKTELAHDQVFSNEIMDEGFYPFDFYHPFWYDREWWGVVDALKDPQKYLNKMMGMADHWIGTMSKGLMLIDGNAPDSEADEVSKKFSTTGGVVKVQDIDNYKLFESKGPSAQLFQMADISRQVLEDHAGGRNFQGQKESAQESGVAVQTRIEQSALTGFVIYDNLRRWKEGVGEKIAWYLTTYMRKASVVRVEGEELVKETEEKLMASDARDWFETAELSPGTAFLAVNSVKGNTIDNLKTDVVIDEARWGATKAQQVLALINAAMQNNPLLGKVFDPMTMIELLPLPFSKKEAAKQRAMQLMQREFQIEQIKATQKPPTVTANLEDVMTLPVDLQAQLLEKFFGLKVDPKNLTQHVPKDSKDGLDTIEQVQKIAMAGEEHEEAMESGDFDRKERTNAANKPDKKSA